MPVKPKILLKSKIFFVGVILSFSACHTSGPVPRVDIKLYAGDSKEAGVSRRNPGSPFETIKCTDSRIDEGYWLSRADFNRLVATYIGACKEWKEGTVLIESSLLWQEIKAE